MISLRVVHNHQSCADKLDELNTSPHHYTQRTRYNLSDNDGHLFRYYIVYIYSYIELTNKTPYESSVIWKIFILLDVLDILHTFINC